MIEYLKRKHNGGVLITTSHRPSKRIRSFVNDLRSVIPNAIRVNRGKMKLHDIMINALKNHCDKIIIVSRWKGNPGKICFYKLSSEGIYIQVNPIIYISSVKLVREIKGGVYFKPKEITINVSSNNKALNDFANMLSEALDIKKQRQSNCYVTIKIKEIQRFFCVILFVKNDTNTICGPIIKVKHVCQLKN